MGKSWGPGITRTRGIPSGMTLQPQVSESDSRSAHTVRWQSHAMKAPTVSKKGGGEEFQMKKMGQIEIDTPWSIVT